MAYIPAQPPSDPKALPTYLQSEFQKIALQLAAQQPVLRCQQQAVLPAKPREGDTVYFAASVTGAGNPNALYQYRGGAWVKVG